MNTTLLVGVTDSLASRVAVEWAVRRAGHTGADVTLVRIADRQSSPSGEIDGRMLLKREAAFAESVASAAVVVRTELVEGRVTEALVAMSADADLFVIGTHHAGVAHGSVFGSTSLQLVASSRAPIVVVPGRVERAPTGVIVGVDDSPAGSAAVRVAAAEADDTGQPLTLIRVWDPPRGREQTAGVDRRHRSAALRLSSLATAARVAHPGLQIQIRSDDRVTARALVDAARAATLLVIGDTYPLAHAPITPGAICHDVLMTIATPTMVVHPMLVADAREPTAA